MFECKEMDENLTLYAHFVHRFRGQEYERAEIKNFLIDDALYLVEDIHMGGSYTSISLKKFKEKVFNSVFFEFYELDNNGDLVPFNIYKSPLTNPYRR